MRTVSNALSFLRTTAIGLLCAVLCSISSAQAQQIEWDRTLSGVGDGAWAMATHEDIIYVLSAYHARLFRLTSDGGGVIWRSAPLSNLASGFAISVNDSGIYIAGRVNGALPGQTAIGLADGFVAHYGFDGELVWSRQFGTPDGEAAFGLAVSDHGLYVAGGPALPYRLEPLVPRPAFLRKYSTEGDFIWQRLITNGVFDSFGFAVDTSDNDAFIAGTTKGLRIAFASRFTADGDNVWTHELKNPTPFLFDIARTIAVSPDGNSIYYGGYIDANSWGNTATGNWEIDGVATGFVEKLDQNGVTQWRRSPVTDTPSQVLGIELKNEELYATGFIDRTSSQQGFAAKLSDIGALLWKRRFSANPYSQGKAIAVLDNSVVVAGQSSAQRPVDIRQTSTFVSRLSDPAAPESRYQLSDLGDIDEDGGDDIGIFINGSPTTFIVKDVATGTTVNQFETADSARTVAVATIRDVNRNGSPEVIWLRDIPIRIEAHDSLTGEFIQDFSFEWDYQALDLAVIDDPTLPNGADFIVLENGSLRAERRNVLSGELIGYNYFNPRFIGKRIFVLPDQNGNGGYEFAALSLDNPAEGSDKLEIRDGSSNTLIRQIWLGNAFTARDAIRLPGDGGAASSFIAVLREQTSDGAVNIIVADTVSGMTRRQIAYNPNYSPVTLIALPDMNGNQSVELGVLGVHRKNGTVRVEIHDSQTNEYIRSVYFDKQFIPHDIVTVGDINGNGVDEIALLGRRNTDGLLRVTIADTKMNRTLKILNIIP